MSSPEARATVYYYLRTKLYGHALKYLENSSNKNKNDVFVSFWHAFTLGINGDYPQSIREFEILGRKRDVAYPCNLALLHFHNLRKNVDYNEIRNLEESLITYAENITEVGNLYTSQFYFYVQDFYNSRKFVERVIPGNGRAVSVMHMQVSILVDER